MKRFSTALIAAFAAGSLAACADGEAEDAGEEIDEAIEDVTGEDTDAFERAGEDIDDAEDEPSV